MWRSPSLDHYLDATFKKIFSIHNEIFNYNDIVQNEIYYMIREFEVTMVMRNRNYDKANKYIERFGDILNKNIIGINEAIVECDEHLENLNNQVDMISYQCKKLLDRQGGYKEKLEERRNERSRGWDKFMQEMVAKNEEEDATFKDKVTKLDTYYRSLKSNLSGGSPQPKSRLDK